MELWQIAIRVDNAADRRQLLRLLRDLHVPMDPCAGDPRFGTDDQGVERLLVVVTDRMRQQLREAGRSFETVRDLRDLPDPIRYVSAKNRYVEGNTDPCRPL